MSYVISIMYALYLFSIFVRYCDACSDFTDLYESLKSDYKAMFFNRNLFGLILSTFKFLLWTPLFFVYLLLSIIFICKNILETLWGLGIKDNCTLDVVINYVDMSCNITTTEAWYNHDKRKLYLLFVKDTDKSSKIVLNTNCMPKCPENLKDIKVVAIQDSLKYRDKINNCSNYTKVVM